MGQKITGKPRAGGWLPPDMIAAVIAMKTGTPVEFVRAEIEADGVRWWDVREPEGGAA